MGIEVFLKSRKPSKIGGLRLLHPSEHTIEHSLGDGKWILRTEEPSKIHACKKKIPRVLPKGNTKNH